MNMDKLPETISLPLLAAKRQSLQGHYMLSELPRLADSIIASPRDMVTFTLTFAQAGAEVCVIGEIEWCCTMLCMRCTQPFSTTMGHSINWQTASDWQSARQLPPEVEPLPAVRETVNLRHLIEDEVLLGLPFSPKHPDSCPRGRENTV
ncbi:MAG: YceD family protein [Candidatus Porifericomitaceae bacterium WSBS_2022_MAG_OTU9]